MREKTRLCWGLCLNKEREEGKGSNGDLADPQVCPKGLNPGKAIMKIKQSIHDGHVV